MYPNQQFVAQSPVFYVAQEPFGSSFLVNYMKHRVLNSNKNFLCIITGETGSGKSFAGLKLGEEIDSNFNVDNVVFSITEFMKFLASDKPKRGSVIMFEEVGVSVSNRNWQKAINKLFNFIMQTFRYKNLIVFFTVPDYNFVDKQTRSLFHAQFELQGINQTEGYSTLKPIFLQRNSYTGEVYTKYPRVMVKEKHIIGGVECCKNEIYTIKRSKIGLASKELIDAYEEKKLRFNKRLEKEVLVGVKKEDPLEEFEREKQEIETKKKEESPNIPQNLTPQQALIYDSYLNKNMSVEQIEQETGFRRHIIFGALNRANKRIDNKMNNIYLMKKIAILKQRRNDVLPKLQ